ncbi:MAG: T9SS type A sorting domain-containing protein [bacterium]|nr:T9SS type A sorting domain-containing protein [bacterium]
MKKLLLILFGCTCIGIRLNAGWIRTYGGTADDGGNSVQQTMDSNYIFAGYTYSFEAGVYLLKINSMGDTLWTKTYGETGCDEWGSSIQQTTDGGFIILGGKGSTDSTRKIWLIKIDANGDTLWTKAHSIIRDYWRLCLIRQTMDGGYIMIGEAGDHSKMNLTDIWLIKADSAGDTLWTKTFGGGGYDWGNSVQQTSDSGYIIVGEAGCGKTAAWDLWLIKTDANGDTLWTRTYGGPSTDGGHSVQQTTDGGYIITGYVDTSTVGTDIWLIKTDSTGDTLWTKIFGNPSPGTGEQGQSVQQTTDGGFIIAGNINIGSNNDIWLIKTDSTGDTLWTRTYSGFAWRLSVQQTIDGGYIVAGETKSGAGDKDIYLIKTDSLGYVIAIEDPSTGSLKPSLQAVDLQISQNPFSHSTVITYQLPKLSTLNSQLLTLKIYDLSGRCVKNLVNGQKPAGTYTTPLNAKELKTGIYFVRLTTDKHKETKKLILIK